jgi:hypothetical protein
MATWPHAKPYCKTPVSPATERAHNIVSSHYELASIVTLEKQRFPQASSCTRDWPISQGQSFYPDSQDVVRHFEQPLYRISPDTETTPTLMPMHGELHHPHSHRNLCVLSDDDEIVDTQKSCLKEDDPIGASNLYQHPPPVRDFQTDNEDSVDAHGFQCSILGVRACVKRIGDHGFLDWA